jgi:hypothetical protein
MEIKMNKNHIFNIFVIATLTLMIALTIQGAIETNKVAMAAGAADQTLTAPICNKPPVAQSSIRRVYVQQIDSWLTYTDGGPTGVDGGLIELLSNARLCSN